MPAWPVKTKEMHNHHLDSTRWNGFPFREGDVVIATWAKSGTTWMQQIVCELIFEGAPPAPAHELSPWIDFRIMPWPETLHAVEAQAHRRALKTHLPVDALVLSPKAKYLYVGRDVRDVVWSMHNHHRAFRPEFLDRLNGVPGLVGEPLGPADPDVRAYYHQFLERDAAPFWPFWSHVQSWWDVRDLPNVKLVHFANLKADPEGQIRAIADFLEIEVAAGAWPAILEHTSFDYMKAHGRETAPMMDHVLEGGAETFINRGVNGRWRDVLSPEEAAKADGVAAARLTPDCAHWLATGEVSEQKSPA
jgi:aryl sulfotransferase